MARTGLAPAGNGACGIDGGPVVRSHGSLLREGAPCALSGVVRVQKSREMAAAVEIDQRGQTERNALCVICHDLVNLSTLGAAAGCAAPLRVF